MPAVGTFARCRHVGLSLTITGIAVLLRNITQRLGAKKHMLELGLKSNRPSCQLPGSSSAARSPPQLVNFGTLVRQKSNYRETLLRAPRGQHLARHHIPAPDPGGGLRAPGEHAPVHTGHSDPSAQAALGRDQLRTPAIVAVRKQTTLPLIMADITSLAKVLWRSGHSVDRAPIVTPIDPTLENPHSA